MEEIQFGGITISIILSILLGLLYKVTGDRIPDRFRALFAVILGIALGLIDIPYSGLEWSVVAVVDHCIQGLVIGASAVGLYELQRTATKPR